MVPCERGAPDCLHPRAGVSGQHHPVVVGLAQQALIIALLGRHGHITAFVHTAINVSWLAPVLQDLPQRAAPAAALGAGAAAIEVCHAVSVMAGGGTAERV